MLFHAHVNYCGQTAATIYYTGSYLVFSNQTRGSLHGKSFGVELTTAPQALDTLTAPKGRLKTVWFPHNSPFVLAVCWLRSAHRHGCRSISDVDIRLLSTSMGKGSTCNIHEKGCNVQSSIPALKLEPLIFWRSRSFPDVAGAKCHSLERVTGPLMSPACPVERTFTVCADAIPHEAPQTLSDVC